MATVCKLALSRARAIRRFIEGAGELLDAAIGIEPMNKGFAVRDRLINEASDNVLSQEKKVESSGLLNGIVQEAKKAEPNSSVLRSLGETLLSILTTVQPLAVAGKAAFEILKSLWS